MKILTDFYYKLKRQYINFSILKAASLSSYIWQVCAFCYAYFFGRGKASYPLNITIDLTYECNLKCPFCFLDFLDLKKVKENKPYLSYKEIKGFIQQARNKKTTFMLTGGEPLLHDDFIEIVKLIKNYQFRCGVFTNATLLDKSISNHLIQAGLDYLFFSLDGPQNVHDRFRGQGSFDLTTKNIGRLSSLRKKKVPRIVMNVLVLKENYQSLMQIIDIAFDLNIDAVAFDFLTFLTEDEFTRHKDFFQKEFKEDVFKSFVYVKNFDFGDIVNLEEIIKNLKVYAQKRKVKIFLKPNLTPSEINCWYQSNFVFKRRCICPWNVLRVSPYGDLYPCAQFFVKMGNIREKSLKQAWNSDKFSNFRMKLKKEKGFPGCNRCVKL